MKITLKEVEVSKLNLKPGDILAVTIKENNANYSDMDLFKAALAKQFPDNKVQLYVLGEKNEMRFSIIGTEAPPVQNFCVDCDCGKKERCGS